MRQQQHQEWREGLDLLTAQQPGLMLRCSSQPLRGIDVAQIVEQEGLHPYRSLSNVELETRIMPGC